MEMDDMHCPDLPVEKERDSVCLPCVPSSVCVGEKTTLSDNVIDVHKSVTLGFVEIRAGGSDEPLGDLSGNSEEESDGMDTGTALSQWRVPIDVLEGWNNRLRTIEKEVEIMLADTMHIQDTIHINLPYNLRFLQKPSSRFLLTSERFSLQLRACFSRLKCIVGSCDILKALVIEKRGILEKKTDKHSSKWKKRFCVLKGRSLFYYKHESDEQPTGAISLERASVRRRYDLCIPGYYPFEIESQYSSSGKRRIIFATVSEASVEEWSRAILKCRISADRGSLSGVDFVWIDHEDIERINPQPETSEQVEHKLSGRLSILEAEADKARLELDLILRKLSNGDLPMYRGSFYTEVSEEDCENSISGYLEVCHFKGSGEITVGYSWVITWAVLRGDSIFLFLSDWTVEPFRQLDLSTCWLRVDSRTLQRGGQLSYFEIVYPSERYFFRALEKDGRKFRNTSEWYGVIEAERTRHSSLPSLEVVNERDVSPMGLLGLEYLPRHAGTLLVRAHVNDKRFRKSFVMLRAAILFIFDKPEDVPCKPRLVIPLEKTSKAEVTNATFYALASRAGQRGGLVDGGGRWRFELHNPSRAVFFSAKDRDSMEGWVECLRDSIRVLRTRAFETDRQPMDDRNNVPSPRDVAKMHEGWLTKRGGSKGHRKTWKRRWFSLRVGCLFYSRYPSAPAKGVVHLESASLQSQVVADCDPRFVHLLFSLTAKERQLPIVFKADNIIEKEEWCRALEEHIQYMSSRNQITAGDVGKLLSRKGSLLRKVPSMRGFQLRTIWVYHGVLFCYKTGGIDSQPEDVFPLEESAVFNIHSGKHQRSFEIRGPSGISALFTAENPDDLNAWVAYLEKIKHISQKEREEMDRRRVEEIEKISSIDSQKTRISKNWFLISAKWLFRWKQFASDAQKGAPPGPISNDTLLDASGQPVAGLVPSRDYRGVSEGVWRTLLAIYGGGPSIERRTLDIYDGYFSRNPSRPAKRPRQVDGTRQARRISVIAPPAIPPPLLRKAASRAPRTTGLKKTALSLVVNAEGRYKELAMSDTSDQQMDDVSFTGLLVRFGDDSGEETPPKGRSMSIWSARNL